MTRFHNSEINLKSSVYNLAGENYIEQLSAYNSMRCHIRRVLLAKSVVDSRNNRYINEKKKRPKSQLSKGYSLDNLIDQLVYDTKHHPMDMLTMNFDEYCLYRKEKENNQAHPRDTSNINLSKLKMQTNDTEDNIQTICRNCPASRPKKNTRYKSVGKKHLKIYQKPLPRIVQRKCRCNEKPIYVNCGNPFKTSTNPLQSDSCTSSSSMIHENRASSSLPCELRNYNRKRAEIEAKEDARYIAFAYDITREIIKCGLYTDKELNEIFKKHLKRHRTTLDLNKMLREIYRLKTFLNVSEESDDSDDDVECCNKDCIWKPQARPPTPPKVLDDNKVIGKLLSYQKLMENQCNKEPNSGKSVVLIDANPELLITERDVLTSLLEVGIDPKQAENICKSLHHKSMESVLENMAELKIRTPCEQLENVTEIQTKDIMCGEKACCDNSQTDTETETLSEKENKSSTTDDLTTQQDETIQTQSCPKTLFNDNYTEPTQSS
ncbi:hypothetical protein KPH14_005083 [Odynerus spinipes]|uniref:Uncharacterized protein n=1 Tax=Odynerus spinipes TaxID=1348599 RepID=A0AAD9VNR6_9HYME|nr:hypothetical protein KPH14_005083 [Odynerus spinipes]